MLKESSYAENLDNTWNERFIPSASICEEIAG